MHCYTILSAECGTRASTMSAKTAARLPLLVTSVSVFCSKLQRGAKHCTYEWICVIADRAYPIAIGCFNNLDAAIGLFWKIPAQLQRDNIATWRLRFFLGGHYCVRLYNLARSYISILKHAFFTRDKRVEHNSCSKCRTHPSSLALVLSLLFYRTGLQLADMRSRITLRPRAVQRWAKACVKSTVYI